MPICCADPRRAVWEKFVFLVGLSSLTALTRQPVGVVRAHPELRRLLRQVMAETAALARAEGMRARRAFVDAQIATADKLPPHVKASMLRRPAGRQAARAAVAGRRGGAPQRRAWPDGRREPLRRRGARAVRRTAHRGVTRTDMP